MSQNHQNGALNKAILVLTDCHSKTESFLIHKQLRELIIHAKKEFKSLPKCSQGRINRGNALKRSNMPLKPGFLFIYFFAGTFAVKTTEEWSDTVDM